MTHQLREPFRCIGPKVSNRSRGYCDYHGTEVRLEWAGPNLKAVCPKCGAYVKFVNPSEVGKTIDQPTSDAPERVWIVSALDEDGVRVVEGSYESAIPTKDLVDQLKAEGRRDVIADMVTL